MGLLSSVDEDLQTTVETCVKEMLRETETEMAKRGGLKSLLHLSGETSWNANVNGQQAPRLLHHERHEVLGRGM